jgi:FkbM family methyltransferase
MDKKEVFYRILDKVFLGKGIVRTINGFRIVFPTRYYKYYESNYEKASFAFVKSKVKPGDVVLDIGGHIGLYAVVFGKLVQPTGKVYSFEPTPDTNKILQKSVVLNKLQKVISVQGEAISKERGETVFYISENNADNSNSLVNYKAPNSKSGIKVPLISIDEFSAGLKKKINFIKIDVEGVELDAVIGARETMLRDRPVCILALHPHQVKSKGDTLEQIWDVVTSYRYEVQYNGKKIDKAFFCAQTDLFDVWLQPLS